MISLIEKIEKNQNLTTEEIRLIMKAIMQGDALHDDMTRFLKALRKKGPTVDEITGAAQIMREFVLPVKSKHRNILDTCGTGGDCKGTFNISTATAIVVAAAGVVVAKHGNRSVSSKCGSADILEELGVNIHVEEAHLTECLDKIGIAFLFAQRLHPAMKNVAPVRKELGVETIFNVLGPLTNPAEATHQMMGVYSRELVEPMVHVLKNLGLNRALVVHGSDGLDEITTTDQTFISEFTGTEIRSYSVSPDELGVKHATIDDLKASDKKESAAMIRDILNGVKGPQRDIVVVNAAYALYTAEAASDYPQGVKLAKQVIDSGQAKDKLTDLISFTNQYKAKQ